MTTMPDVTGIGSASEALTTQSVQRILAEGLGGLSLMANACWSSSRTAHVRRRFH